MGRHIRQRKITDVLEDFPLIIEILHHTVAQSHSRHTVILVDGLAG